MGKCSQHNGQGEKVAYKKSVYTVSAYLFFPHFFSFLIYFLIEGYLIYRILLFSVKPQHESAIGVYIYIPSLWNLPPVSLPIPPL